jgi:hypothetical protein
MPSLAHVLLRAATALGLLGLCTCAPPASPPATPHAPSDEEARALAQVALDAIQNRGCARLVTQTFPIDDPTTQLSTGRVWPRKCTAQRTGDGLHVEAEIVGWQWIDQQSAGFAVHDWVYFRATLAADLGATVRTDASGHVTLKLKAADAAKVKVAALGEVRAHASNPAAALMGIATGIVGLGPNTLATNAMRGRVRDVFIARASSGFDFALDDPSLASDAPSDKRDAPPWLDQTQGLFPRGALLSGSFPAGAIARLDYDIEGDASVLARPVCVEEAAATIDTFLADKPEPHEKPAGVIELKRRGQVVLPALRCPWLLVTGVRDDVSATAKIRLSPVPRSSENWGEKRWVRATLVSFTLEREDPEGGKWDPPNGAADPLFSIGPPGRQVRLGPAMPNTLAAAPWVVAPLFELSHTDLLELHVVDLDPKPRSWLTTTTEYDEQLVGDGRIDVDAISKDAEITVPITKNGRSTGSAKLRFSSVRVE